LRDADNARKFNEYLNERIIYRDPYKIVLNVSKKEGRAIRNGLLNYVTKIFPSSFTECMQEAYAKQGIELIF